MVKLKVRYGIVITIAHISTVHLDQLILVMKGHLAKNGLLERIKILIMDSVGWWSRDSSCFYTDENDDQYVYSIQGVFKSIAWIHLGNSGIYSHIANSDDNNLGILVG